MATEADDVPDPTSVLKRESEGKEMTSELSNITVSEGPQEEKRKIESWLSQPPEMMEFLGKTGTEEVGDDDEVVDTNVINKGNGETDEGDVFSKSLSVTDEKSERFTEHSQMTLEGEKSMASIDTVGIEMDPEMIRPTIDKDRKNEHGSSLLDAPVEETTSEKAGPDVGEIVEENISSKEASQEAVELTEKINDSTSNDDVFFHEVDNLETSAKESESGMKDIVKESQQEAEHKNEILENIATADSDQSKTSKLDEIDDRKNDVSFGQPLDSPEDNVEVEEQEKTETLTHEEQSGHSHMQKTEQEAPADSKEIETEGATKYAEVITNIEEQRPAGSPEEIAGEERRDETVISYDIDKNETQEVNNIATVDSDEKTRSAELEIPNKSGSESWITHPPIEEEVQVVGEKQDEVSMSESGNSREAIQIPSVEEKHVNETAEATKSPESKILEHTATEVTSTSEMDINTEKGCELKSEEALKEINPEDNMEEDSKEQIEKFSNTEFLVQRESDDNERSTIEEDNPIKDETPLCSGEEEYRQDQEEKVGSNSFLEEIRETDSGDQSYITSDEINTPKEQIINQEVCEDTKIVDRAEDTEKEMKNDENTVTDFSPEPMGERTIKCSEGNEAEAKKQTAEASEQYDTCGESVAMEESAITDLPPSHVQEEEVEESLIENRREAMISDKEVLNSNNECIEQDFEATHLTKENISKDLKNEEEANEGLNAQSIIRSSEEETAQESNSNLVQSSSVPEIIEKEVNRELLEKEESKDTVQVEEARLTEVDAENQIQVDNSNLMSEAKGQVTTETSEMRSNDIDIIAESSEISIVGDNKTMEIPTERKDGADESTEKTQPEGKSETCDESSKPEDQGEIATVETSLEYMPHRELLESSIVPLEAHNLVAEVSETTGEAPDKVKTLSDKEETPLVAETTEEHVAEKEDESLLGENDVNMGSIDIGKESTIEDSWVEDQQLHEPLELNSGKSRTESDVELLKGVNASEAANGSDVGKLETLDDEKSSYKEVETDKSEYEEAVNEASQGIRVGGGRIENKKTIQEQKDSAMHFEGRSKESVEMEKGAVEFESEAHSGGREASETPTISAHTEKKIEVEDKELASELPNATANEVPSQEKSNTEYWLDQPPETLEILETECMQVAPNVEVGNVNVADKGNVGITESESFLTSTSVDDGKLSGFQEEEKKLKMIKDEDVIVEASYGQDGGVRIQSPELTEGSSRDVEIPNEVLNEENMENITSTVTTSVEQDLKETSFEGEDKKSNTLEMDPEATQPSTDIEDEKNKVEEMPCHGVKDVCVSTETDEPMESNVGATDRLGSSLVAEPIEETRSTKAGPDVRKNLEENSSMACEDESQETGTLSEKIKDDASIEDEVQNQNLESSFVKKVEDFEISKEESETGMKDIDKEKQNEAENQNNTLDNTATADRSLSTEVEDVENPERKSHISDTQPEESTTRESEDVTSPEALTMECEPEVMVVPGEDSVVVEEQKTTETSKHEENSEQSLKENAEPANENVGSPMVVASEEFEATSLDDHAEIITNIEEESPVGNTEEILGERKNEINNKEISEAESQSALDLDNNTRSAEIPDNSGEEVCVTHPPMEETVLEGGEKQVSMLQSVDQVQEASAPEFPKDEEKNASDSNEASKSPDSECSISEQTSAKGEVNIETTRSVEEIPVGSQEEIHGQPTKDETMTADDVNNKETPEAENLSTVDLYCTPPSVEETFLEEGEKKNDVSVLESGNQVSEASEVPREEEKDGDDTYEAIKSPEINILERTSNEGALNMEATSTRSAADITLEKGSELISEDELKELKSEENKEEVTEEKAAVTDFQIPTKSDDEENSTIKEESLLKNNIPTCTAEGEYHHDQGDEVMPNRSKEALPALDSIEQSLSTSNEIKIINDQIMNEEASNVHGSHGTAPASMTTDECSASDIPSSSIGEDKVEERMKDDIGDETKSEIEVSNSTAECIEQTFDAACSTEEREDRTLKHEESITESPSEQTTQEGRNLDITENYSSVPDVGGEEVKEEVLEKEDTNVPVAAKETSLTQTEGENVKNVDSSDLFVEEKCLVPTEISEGSNAVTRTAETSILGENNDVEVPTAREVATVETSLDDVSEQMLQASSIQKSEEHNLVSPEGETTGEAPEKDSTFYEKAETPLAEETTEDEITEIEDESLHPMKDSNMGLIEKENDYAAVEDRELYTPPKQNIEESTFESDVEHLSNAKSETVEELKSSEKDNPEYETAISGTSEGVETCGGCMDSEKAILEQEDSAKNLEGSSMESDDIEKALVEFEAETHSSETSEVKSISTLKEEDQNINVVEHDVTATESMAKDEDNRRFPETNPTNSEEERQDDENQTIASKDEQINRQDIQEGKREMNEEMEPKFDTQDKINGTQDAVLTEKVSTEIESASERETIKEQNTEEESCTKELHMSPAADGTINEVPTVLESTSESEIIEGQNTEEESCTKELHTIKLADGTVDEVRDLDLTPIQSLEATASNKNDEIMRSEAAQKEVNETEDAFSTEEVSRETSSAMDEVTCPDLAAIHSLEATASNNITETMESKTAQDLNEESLEDETKNIEMPVDVSSLVSEGSEEKMKGEKIEDMESGNEETDMASTVVTDLSSLGEVQLNDEPVKAIDASSDADAGEQKLEETAEKSDANDVEVEVTEIPDSVVQTEDQAVEEIHETHTRLNAIDADTQEIEQQIREVPEVLLKPTNQHGDEARDEEIIPGQASQVEKIEEQLQVPFAGLLSEEQESETTTRIEKGGTNEDAMEEAKMRQAEVSMVMLLPSKRTLNEQFKTPDEISRTRYAISTEKVSKEIESASERETIKEQMEESCTNELHMSPVTDGTVNEVPTVLESTSESEIIKGQIMEEESCMKELHKITLADEVRDADLTPTQSLEATASNKNDEMMRSDIAEDINMESEATQKEVNETQDAFSTEEVSRETSSAMDEVTCPDLAAIHSLEATASNNITETMESKTAQDLNEESEASPMAEVLEDETKNIEKPGDFTTLISEGSVEKMKGEKIEDMESGNDETDIASTVVTNLSSLGEVQLNDEPVKAVDTSSDAVSLRTTETADAGGQELEETAEKSDANDVEVEVTKIPESVVQTEDQTVKEIHKTGTSLNAIDADTQEIEQQIREVPEVLLEPTNQRGDEARDEEIIPGQAPQVEKTEEQLQVPSTGLLSEEQESETTTIIEKGGMNEDAMEEAKMHQAEVSMVSKEIESAFERETIKEQMEESCTNELHMSPVTDGTVNEVPTVLESTSESEIIKGQIMEEESCTKELHKITLADEVRDADLTPIQSLEATASNKNDEMMRSDIAEDINMESEATQKEVNETQDAFSTEEVSRETSSAMDEVTYPDQTAIHSLEATASNKITEMMESKTAQDLNEESEASPMAEVLEDETKNIEKPGDVSSLTSEVSEEKMKGEKIEDMESGNDETDIASTVVKDLSSLGEVQLNDEPVKAVDTSSDAVSLRTIETADAGEQELEETAEKSDANGAEVEVTEIPDSVVQTEDQAVKEIHETGTSLNAIDVDTQEIEQQIREVPEVLLEPTNQRGDEARDEEIIPGQAPQVEKTEEQLQVPSAGLLSEEQESETTTRIEKGGTNEEAMEEAKTRQAEVSTIREELETTSEGEGIGNQVQGEEKRVQDFAKELDADSSRDNTIFTKMSAQEVLETNHGGEDTDEPVKAIVTSSDTGSLQTTETSDASQQELEEKSSMVSPFPVEEHEKSENISVNVDKSDAYDVEEKEFEIHGDVPEGKDQKVQEIQGTGASLAVEEAHTNETANQNREAPEGFSEAINQGVEAPSEAEIIAPAVAMEVTNLGEVQLNERVETLDANSGAKNVDTIKTADASQQNAEFDNIKLEETCIMASQPPIHEHEKVDEENIPPEKLEANYIELEETKIPERVPEYQDQAVKDIHETGTSLDVGDSDTNEIEKPISEVPQALMEPKNQCVDTARDDEITSIPILRGEKLEEQLQAPSSGLLSKEQERETTTENEKGSTDKDATEGTTVLQAEIREELETTSEGKGTENQVQAEEKRVQDWSKVYSPEELDTKSSEDNAAMIPKMSREEVLETNPVGHDTDEHVKALDTSSDTESLQTTQTPNASQQELEETHSMVSQLPGHEYEKPDDQSVTAEKSDAYNVEVKEIDLPGVLPESKDQRVKQIHEVGTHVEETQTNEMETQVREVREALSEDVSQSVETISGDEIIAPSEATKVTTLGELQVNDEHVEAPDTIKTGDGSQQDAQFDSVKHEETSTTVAQLPIHEDEKEESENRPIDKSDANDVEVEEAEVHDTVPESEDQAVKEIHETSRSLTVGGADANEIEKQIRVPEALSEPINPYFDTSRDDEMTPVQTLQAEITDEQLQVPSSGLFSKEEDGETSTEIEKGSTDKDGTEVGNLELQENSGLIEEKSDADEVGLIETKTLDAVSESKDQVFEVVHDIGTIQAAEETETDKVEEEIEEVTEKVPDPGYKGGDAATDDENLNHPLPVGKLEEQIQLSSSSYESTKEDATELDKSELEEATGLFSKLPTTEHGTRHLGTTIEKSEADEIQVEEAKTSEAIFESEGDGFEEIKEIGSSLPVEKTCTDEVKEETKAVPETIFEPNYEGAQTAIEVETAINQTLTPQGVEQLQEPKSTTEKPCLQDEGLKDLEVSNLELKVQDSQDISAEEENTGLKNSSTDAPSEFEESPIQGSSQEASTDEDIVYLKNSNKDADYLPPPYPTVTELSTEDKGGKSEEASNLEFEKNGKVLLESVSTINSLEAPVTTEGIEVREEYPLETTTELGDGENHCEETTEEEAIEKHISKEKTTEEMQGSRNFDPVSLGEETATKTNQEGKLMAENYPGERANALFEASRNEVQHEMVFEESQEAGADKSTEEEVTADDKGPYQLSVGDEIANVTPPEEAKDGQNIQKIPNESELKSHGDETDSTDAATEAAAQIKELKSSEAMLVSHEVERIGDNVEETVISKDRKLQNTAPDVPPEADAAAEKAPDGEELQTFDDFCEPALEGPPHGFTEPYEHKKEIVNTGTIDSESLMDTEKPEHTFLEPGCEGTGGTEDLDLTNKDGSNKPSISSATATSQETIADEESEKAIDAKQHGFMSDEPTAEPASIPEEGFQLEENTMDKEAVELSALGDKRKLDEAKIQTITAIEDEETQQENDGLPHIKDSEKEVSHEKVLMKIPEEVQGPEETSLAMPHEQIASKTDPSESIERTNPTASKDAPVMQDNAAAKTFQNVEVEDLNAGRDVGSEPEAKGMECAEENRMGEKSEEITEDSQKIESAKMSLTDLLQRSTKRNSQVVEDLTEERELMGNKEEPQNATAETVQAEEAEVHETKDEEEEVDEHKREDSGSDAPVMVEASRDMDVKTVHKKSHHNILSGVGSKVKHSLAKVKKAITGKSSHPKPTSPK